MTTNSNVANSVFVAGASGFVGRNLCSLLVEKKYKVNALIRNEQPNIINSTLIKKTILPSFENLNSKNQDISDALKEVDTVVYLAARVHMMHETSADPLKEYRKINVDACINLANIAAKSGVRRFIYLSSAKVNGEQTLEGKSFKETDEPNPQDYYSQSKWEAEQALQQISQESKLEVVIIRPPLVYGRGVKANFAKLLSIVQKGWPIPFGAIKNQRSLIYVDNLSSAILACINHPQAKNQTFLVSDGEDVSTSELVIRLAKAIKKPAHLLPVAPKLMLAAGSLIGKKPSVERLTSSLSVDIQKIRTELNWSAPYKMQEAFERDFA